MKCPHCGEAVNAAAVMGSAKSEAKAAAARANAKKPRGKRLTLAVINEAIKATGYELVKGRGYFYFYPLSDDTPELYDCSVMTPTLGKELYFWTSELEVKIKATLF